MFQLRKVLVRGHNVPDAELKFEPGANILAGFSDTGKSYLVQCLDFIFGADTIKRLPLSEPYSQLFVEFANDEGEPMTLYRPLSGGNLTAQRCSIEDSSNTTEREIIVPRRRGRSQAKDVTSALFPFADLPEAQLRRNRFGELQRLTFRHWIPSLLVDEVAVIDARSPVRGPAGFDTTIHERAFAFSLSGRDDGEIVSAERNDVVVARLQAKLAVIDTLLEPLDARLAAIDGAEESIDKVEKAIAQLSTIIDESAQAHEGLQSEREAALAKFHKADGQVLAIDELLVRYRLLDGRYASDLERLDFIAEGAHYFGGLQSVDCPLCDQPMGEHQHDIDVNHADIQVAARAEAAKILALRADLTATIENVEARRGHQVQTREQARETMARVDREAHALMSPTLRDADARLSRLVERRVILEAARSDKEQAEGLRKLRGTIEAEARRPRATAQTWEALPSKALDEFCGEIESVLREWAWPGRGKVTFDQNAYDIDVDGQSRQSHGKGVRGVLYAAFVIGLLNYCRKRGLPHSGLVVIDSPLTAFSKQRNRRAGGALDPALDAGVEAKFWESLTRISPAVQVIVIENKAPPVQVAGSVAYTWFAGEFATDGQRAGFFPVYSQFGS